MVDRSLATKAYNRDIERHLSGGKELELACEVEQYELYIFWVGIVVSPQLAVCF